MMNGTVPIDRGVSPFRIFRRLRFKFIDVTLPVLSSIYNLRLDSHLAAVTLKKFITGLVESRDVTTPKV